MEKITITIEGTSGEVIKALRSVSSGLREPAKDIAWLPREIEAFFDNLQSEAQRILKEIAKKPDGYDRDELIEALEIPDKGLPGRLSSVGHNLNRLFPAKPSPIELDYDTWKYKMLPEFADWLVTHE